MVVLLPHSQRGKVFNGVPPWEAVTSKSVFVGGHPESLPLCPWGVGALGAMLFLV